MLILHGRNENVFTRPIGILLLNSCYFLVCIVKSKQTLQLFARQSFYDFTLCNVLNSEKQINLHISLVHYIKD